jgi:hypothetical protein
VVVRFRKVGIVNYCSVIQIEDFVIQAPWNNSWKLIFSHDPVGHSIAKGISLAQLRTGAKHFLSARDMRMRCTRSTLPARCRSDSPLACVCGSSCFNNQSVPYCYKSMSTLCPKNRHISPWFWLWNCRTGQVWTSNIIQSWTSKTCGLGAWTDKRRVKKLLPTGSPFAYPNFAFAMLPQENTNFNHCWAGNTCKKRLRVLKLHK